MKTVGSSLLRVVGVLHKVLVRGIPFLVGAAFGMAILATQLQIDLEIYETAVRNSLIALMMMAIIFAVLEASATALLERLKDSRA